MAAGEAATAFVETSLDTRLAVSFPASATTIADLKRIVSEEHAASFPHTGRITVESFKVRRRGSWYHLTDSMAVRAAFHGVKGGWHLQAHVLPHPAPPSSSNADMLHPVFCSQQTAIGSQGPLFYAPSTGQQEDGHGHIGDDSALAPHIKRNSVEGGGYAMRGEKSDADAGGEDRHSPARGEQAAVIKDPRGRKNFREGDGDHDQSLPVDCDDQNKCRDNSTPKRICAREHEFLNQVDANSVGSGGEVDVHSSDDEMLEDEGALDNSYRHDEGLNFVEKKEEEAVSARPADHEVESSVQLCTHETMSITDDKMSQLGFSVNKNVSTNATEEQADEGMAEGKLVEQHNHLDKGAEVLQGCNSKDTSGIHSEYVSDSYQYEVLSRSFDLKCCNSSKCEILTDQVGDHNCVCSEVELTPIERASQETDYRSIKTVPATVFGPPTPNLELSEKKFNSMEQDYHRSNPLLHDLDECACSSREKPICGQNEPWVADVCNSASSKKGRDLPPCVQSKEEVNSSEKEAMARKLKGKELWTAKVCNGERSSRETDSPPRAESTKEDNPSEKEATAREVEEKEPWTGRMCDGGRSSIKGTDHPPCARSMRVGNSSEKERVAHEERQSTRTVTLVDMDGTKWKVQLDDTFELGPQESSSFSWSEKENSGSDAEEIQSHLAKPHQNAEERPEGAPENGGTRVPSERSDLPGHGSFKTPASSGPTGSKHAGGTSADDAEQGAWNKSRRPRQVVRKIPNSRAVKMYGYR